MRWMFVLALAMGCSGSDGDGDGSGDDGVDPMVGDWVAVEGFVGGDTFSMPLDYGKYDLSWELELTDEPRGRFVEVTIDDSGQRQEYGYELDIDVFDVGQWTLENPDPSLDFILDCEVEGGQMSCFGGFDGGKGDSLVFERR